MSRFRKFFFDKNESKPEKSNGQYRQIETGENVLIPSAMPKYCDIGNLIFEGKHKEAIELGEALLKESNSDEYNANIYVNLMLAYFKLRDKQQSYFEKSTICAKNAILLGHNTGYAHERLAINLEKSGKINQAIQLCDLILNPRFKFSPNGCGNSMDFEKRKTNLLKKLNKATDTQEDLLFTEQETKKIISYQ